MAKEKKKAPRTNCVGQNGKLDQSCSCLKRKNCFKMGSLISRLGLYKGSEDTRYVVRWFHELTHGLNPANDPKKTIQLNQSFTKIKSFRDNVVEKMNKSREKKGKRAIPFRDDLNSSFGLLKNLTGFNQNKMMSKKRVLEKRRSIASTQKLENLNQSQLITPMLKKAERKLGVNLRGVAGGSNRPPKLRKRGRLSRSKDNRKVVRFLSTEDYERVKIMQGNYEINSDIHQNKNKKIWGLVSQRHMKVKGNLSYE